ncbi:MAG: NAD(P)/FAD-dependent oxidoreductase [Gammaproteobacteria bacterium]|nr:MAG: NAD(P)/FAD-dependent oxidoreductase [Gammaproteobacteria bacterium]
MKYDYDLITIGVGPAGMAVSVMGAEMGLKVCAIEKHKLGGECMNVGCIPSKSLLRMAKTRHQFEKLAEMELESDQVPSVLKPFSKIQGYLDYINEAKTVSMFEKVDLLLAEGSAEFVDKNTVKVGEKTVSAKRIFVCVGTRPMVPPIPGIEDVDILTNENMFKLEEIPESMVIIGGGAIGTEMAQAFSRLGTKCSLIHMAEHLIPTGDPEAGELLKEKFEEEGIAVYNGAKIEKIEKDGDLIKVYSDKGEVLEGKKLLVAAGRKPDFSELDLQKAGIETDERGYIKVNDYLQTTSANIYGVGDCNGHFLLSHSAMHQGMIAIMNSMMFGPMRRKFQNYVVPWTVFTEPQISSVGLTEKELIAKGIKYEVIKMNYADYGAAIAENIGVGYVKAFVSITGKIYGASIVGEGSGEMINEWGLAIQKKMRMHDIMFLQHSFPTMGFLTKRASEQWMMNRMKSGFLKRMCQIMF